jgi:hypothetical protein
MPVTSRYLGVSYVASSGRYQASLVHGNKTILLGEHAGERAAALARDRAALHFGLRVPLNSPGIARKAGPASPATLRAEARRALTKGDGKRYLGVCWNHDRRKWDVTLRLGRSGAKRWIAQFADPEDAAIAYDRVALCILGSDAPRNFPRRRLTPATIDEIRDWAASLTGRYRRGHAPKKPPSPKAARTREPTSASPRAPRKTAKRGRKPYTFHEPGEIGVYRPSATARYQARLGLNGKSICIGSYADARTAALAHDRAALYFKLDTVLNYPKIAKRLGPASLETLRRDALPAGRSSRTSRYRGVFWEHRRTRWEAKIALTPQRRFLIAQFIDEEHAAIAYDRVALWLWGPSAPRNFPKRRFKPATIGEMRDWASSLTGYPRLRGEPEVGVMRPKNSARI